LVKDWSRTGHGLVRNWSGFGDGFAKDWSWKDQEGLVTNWSGSGQELVREARIVHGLVTDWSELDWSWICQGLKFPSDMEYL
jgi:hypothetical protein